MFTLPAIRIGDPIRHESLTVFPLFAEPHGKVEYLLSDEAIKTGVVTVQEVSEGGSVPDLLVENSGDTSVSSSSKGKNSWGPSRIASSTHPSSSRQRARPRFRSVAWSEAAGLTNPGTSVPTAGILHRSCATP